MENDILKQLLTCISKGKFKVAYSDSLSGYFEGYIERIKGAVKDGNSATIWFKDGLLIIKEDDMISKINRPLHLTNECEWCYEIKSKTGILIGWILKDKELTAI